MLSASLARAPAEWCSLGLWLALQILVLSCPVARSEKVVLSAILARSSSMVLSSKLARSRGMVLSTLLARSLALVLSSWMARSLALVLSLFQWLSHRPIRGTNRMSVPRMNNRIRIRWSRPVMYFIGYVMPVR